MNSLLRGLQDLREKIEKLPRRIEYLSGQQTSYVQLDNVLALLEELEDKKPEHEWEFYMDGTFGMWGADRKWNVL